MSRHAHLNLRWNPFGEAGPADRAALAVVDVERLRPLLGRRRAVQLRADHGRGKSTTLLAMRAALAPGAPLIRAGRHRGPLPSPVDGFVFVDEAQQGARARLLSLALRVARGDACLVLSTHSDRRGLLTLAGLAVSDVSVPRPDEETLVALVERRMEWARKGDGPLPGLSRAGAAAILARFGDDLRSAEAWLYDRIEALSGIEDALVPPDFQSPERPWPAST